MATLLLLPALYAYWIAQAIGRALGIGRGK